MQEPFVGILMLESRFPRIPGDAGNPASWPFPVRLRVVRGATPERVVRGRAEGLIEPFIAEARALRDEGAAAITTTCGFLSLFQRELAAAVDVPVLTSALVMVGWLEPLLPPGRSAGILTISASALGPEHLRAAGVPEGAPIGTTEGGREFTRAILGDEPGLDIAAARADNVAAARTLQARHPELGAIVLECTNMCPYAADITRETGLPTFSILDAVSWLHAGLAPRRFPAR